LVEGRPINEYELYTIANSDYIANGGSNCDFLKPIPQSNKGYLVREALMEYIKNLQKRETGRCKTENRTTYANN